MKFKVGDKVRVRKDLEEYRMYGNQEFVTSMKGYKGQKATIKNIDRKFYKLDIDNEIYYWTDEMLEPIAENTVENTDEVSTNSVETIDQFTKEDFKFGDIVTLRNGDEYIYIKKKIINEKDYEYWIETYNKDFTYEDEITRIPELDIMKVERLRQFDGTFYKYETLYERKEILDEEEKEYLGKFIEPFKNRVKVIMKRENSNYKEYKYIKIEVKSICETRSYETTVLPYFKNELMYNNMELDKPYTLEELGL